MKAVKVMQQEEERAEKKRKAELRQKQLRLANTWTRSRATSSRSSR